MTWTGTREVSTAGSIVIMISLYVIQILDTGHTGGEKETCQTATRSASTSKYTTSTAESFKLLSCMIYNMQAFKLHEL